MKVACSAGRPARMTTSPEQQRDAASRPQNRLSVGAARLTTPKARLTTRSAVTPGSATARAPAEELEPQ